MEACRWCKRQIEKHAPNGCFCRRWPGDAGYHHIVSNEVNCESDMQTCVATPKEEENNA